MKTKHGFKDVLIGLEPTGHYWKKIAYFAKDQGYAIRFIRTHFHDLTSTAHATASARTCDNSGPVICHSELLFRGSSFELMYSMPSGPIAVTCVM